MALGLETELGAALRSLRQARGLGLDETARQSGASKAALSAWENGNRRPRGPALVRLLDALGADSRTKTRLLQIADPQQVRLALADSVVGRPVDLGKVLRVLRERRGVSQTELARLVGVSQAAVSKWESEEATPSTETIHAIGFALGASVEETLALASVAGNGQGGLSDDPKMAREQVWSRRVQDPLTEVSLLGWEAELRRRAARDSSWDPCLVAVLASRTNWLVYTERYREIDPIARQAIRLAATAEGRMEAVPAVAALADADRHLGRGHANAAELAGILAEKLPETAFKAWMLRQTGMSLLRLGHTAKGLEKVVSATEMDLRVHSSHPDPWSHQTSMVCEAYLEAGEARKAAALLGGRRERDFTPSVFVAVEHANGRAATEAEMAYLRFWTAAHSPSLLDRRRLERMERRQARLTGRQAGSVVGRQTEDQLWDAVVRESRG